MTSRSIISRSIVSRSIVSRIATTFRNLAHLSQQLSLVLVGTLIFLSLLQPAVQAASIQNVVDTAGAAVEGSSSESLSELRAERRKEQSQASRAANTEDKADSFEEAIEDKLNLDEIVEDNVLFGNEPKGDRATTSTQPQSR